MKPATCRESSCERMSNLQHQLPSSPDWFSHGPAVENGLAFISRSYQISSSSTRRWSRAMMNDQWFPLQGHPDASKHPPPPPPAHVWCVPVCVRARTASVCLCFPSDMEVAFVCSPNETSPLWQIRVRRGGCLRRLHYSGEWLGGCEGLHSKSATTPRSTRGVRYLRKFLKLLQKLVYLSYFRGCLQFSVILNTQCVSQSQL